jgi:hypothetical protein
MKRLTRIPPGDAANFEGMAVRVALGQASPEPRLERKAGPARPR